MEAKIKELIKDIEVAFADTPYPVDGRIGTFELTVSFRGLQWKDVPLEMLFFHRDAITSFDPEAFRYFLPAMLMGVLLHREEVDTLTNLLIASLTPPQVEDYYWDKKFNQIIELLNTNEKKALYKFLLIYRELYPDISLGYGENNIDAAIKFWATNCLR